MVVVDVAVKVVVVAAAAGGEDLLCSAAAAAVGGSAAAGGCLGSAGDAAAGGSSGGSCLLPPAAGDGELRFGARARTAVAGLTDNSLHKQTRQFGELEPFQSPCSNFLKMFCTSLDQNSN